MQDADMWDASEGLFNGMVFAVITTSLTQDEADRICGRIREQGGEITPFNETSGLIETLEQTSYIITETTDFPDYFRALEHMIDIVKPRWVYDCIMSKKMKNPRSYSADPSLFMSETVVCCGQDLPEGDKEAITAGVLAMGGQHASQLSKITTHLIALSIEDERCQLALRKRLEVIIVLPHWFDDCLKVGRRIHERPYLLPDPEIMELEPGDIPSTKTNPNIRDATQPEPTAEPAQPAILSDLERPRRIKAFESKRVVLANDLNLNKRLKNVIGGLIEEGGGSITTTVNEADIYVCNYREGRDYVKASQAGKDVGNLSWLYYLIAHGSWTNPMRRLLHYPRPPQPIGNFGSYKISISGYTGESRMYLESLVKALGAQFTKTFKQDNTHLVAAHKRSEKCEAAEEWGVDVVSHLWLEESYSQCREQPLTNQRYTHFPPRTNMGEVLGATQLDREAVEKASFPRTQRPTEKKAVQPSETTAAGKSAKGGGGEAGTPATRRFGGKENETPGTTGSRGAKDRAISNLHEAMDDANKFQKELKRKGGVTHGGKRPKDDEVAEKPKKGKGPGSKRPADAVEDDGSSTVDETEEPVKHKKARKEQIPIKYRMLVTGLKRWQGDQNTESKDKARLREMGVFIIDDYKKADLLCAPKIVRTLKFVASIAVGPQVVNSDFLNYALKHDEIPAPEDYPLIDDKFEESNGLSLADAIARARQNKQRLFKDWTIFCTSNVKPVSKGFETYSEIIAANGGRCQRWQGRTTNVTASKRKIDALPKEVSQNLEEDEGDVLYLISEPLKTEVPLWEKFRTLAKKHDMIPKIVSTEWLLHVAMAQKLYWDPAWELSEEKLM